MRILIGAASSKFFHLEEFAQSLERAGSQCKLVHGVEILNGFPSKNPRQWISSKGKFNDLIKTFRPDLVFTDSPSHFGLGAINAKIPLLMYLRGDYWSEMRWAKQTLCKGLVKRSVLHFKNRIAEKCFENSTAIVPISRYLKDIVDVRFPGKASDVLYHGIDSSRWHSVKGMRLKHPCVGILQRATIWGKTKEMLVLKKILKEMPETMFYWAGDGAYRDRILPELEKFSNFKWLGPLEYPDKVREFLSEIDIYALVSGADTLGLTLLEAQLMKKPVVATDVGGVSEAIENGKTGFLVDKGDSEAYVRRLSTLLNDSDKQKSMGESGRKFVEERFNLDKIAKNFIDIAEKSL